MVVIMASDKTEDSVVQAARGFDAAFSSGDYSRVHNDDAQLERLLAGLAPRAGQTILDLGTGTGYVALALAKRCRECRVIGLDVSAAGLDSARRAAAERGLTNIDFQLYDGVVLPFAAGSCDAAVSRYAWHHLPRPETTLEGLARAVRGGGRFVLADAIRADADAADFANRFQQLKPDGHIEMLERQNLLDQVGRHGFSLIDTFASSIRFSRRRDAAYDALLADTLEASLAPYQVETGADNITLTLPILNAVFERTVS